VRFGLSGGPRDDWTALRDFVQMAEELGFDSYWRPDQPLDNLDCWTTLAAVAAVTRTIRLGTSVACVFYRHPALLARMAADVDRISGGRAVLGLGSGDEMVEFRRLGMRRPPIVERQATLAEALRIIPPLLAGETVTYRGQYFDVEDAQLDPCAVQKPYVPILVAGGGPWTTLRYAAEYADASNVGAGRWGGGVFTAEDTVRTYTALRQRCAEVGRPYEAVLRVYQFFPTILAGTAARAQAKSQSLPSSLLTFAGQGALITTYEEAVARIRPLVEAGCQYFVFSIRGADTETPRLLAERVLPALSAPPGRAASEFRGA
jgi:alkanesulfonate monooxygenase SsuD/methylene tetrahydromethanopterin reductase-like flavin-dependent oxidoreductase (luciferase family)